MPRHQPGHIFRLLRQIRLARLQHCRRVTGLSRCRFQRLFMPSTGLGKLSGFPFQPFDGFTRVAVQTAFAFDIPRQLRNPAGERFNLLFRPRLLVAERIPLHHKALQDRSRNRFFLSQRRQRLFRRSPHLACLLHQRLGLCRRCDPFAQRLFRCRPRIIRLTPATIEQHAFCLTQLIANLAVARRLPGLARKLGQLAGQLLNHIIHARQVCLGTVELQFRLMPPLIKARNPRRLFQNAPSVLGLGVDQLRNLPLPHQGRAMRASGGIRKEHLHIPRPHILAARLIGAAHVPRDAPHDVELIIVIKPRRGQPI